MSSFESAILGLVQGLTEFLPISSSAHLVLVPAFLGWGLPPLAFDVLLHAASLVAVLAYFRREFLVILGGIVRPGPGRKLLVLLVVGTIPAAVVGFVFEQRFEAAFERPARVGLELVGTGLILVLTEVFARRKARDEGGDASGKAEGEDIAEALRPTGAILVGLGQAVSILPGISRSGSTIGAGMLVGLTRAQAARFSFMLLVPSLAGAGILKIPEIPQLGLGIGPLAIGFLVCLVASYAAIGGLISYLQRRGLYPFAVYCLVVGTASALILSR
ncbi:MAG: undecaprenyl-diphosphate phosphatase [Actinomycetota bacterium]